jgi:2-keto-4-pentenoate hydratase
MTDPHTMNQALSNSDIDKVARLLADARKENRLLDCIPLEIRPQSLGDAYAIQERLADRLGLETGGWFCACTNPNIQTMLGLDEPYYARLFKAFILESPASLRSAHHPPMVLECEFGFRLNRDLPDREEPYSRVEVERAIASVHPTIEVVTGHLRNWPEQDVFSIIADNGTDGALVFGQGTERWQSLDLVNTDVCLTVNGKLVRTGTGRNVSGDPVSALVWLVNARSRDGRGLKAGDIHNTGTATDIIWVKSGDEATVEFHGLGSVKLSVE